MRAAYAVYLPLMDRPPAPMIQDFAAEIAAARVHVLDGASGLRVGLVCWPETGHLMLDTLAVAPAAQGHGLGRAAMAWVEARARQAGKPTIRLYTNDVMTENMVFYQKLGYRITHRAKSAGYDRIFFEKRLRP